MLQQPYRPRCGRRAALRSQSRRRIELPDGARLRFERVQSDSRCPMDALCVWAGDATISVTLNPANGPTESREMHTQPTGSQIWYANYTITLTALAPYPDRARKFWRPTTSRRLSSPRVLSWMRRKSLAVEDGFSAV